MEAHILTTLTQETQHLILIGELEQKGWDPALNVLMGDSEFAFR